ncbi:hypothetical protein GCM10009122_36480 [Fulvivirga kasyanovii]
MREAGNQTKATGNDMRIEGSLPDLIMDNPLFDPQKGHFIVKSEIGDGNIDHQHSEESQQQNEQYFKSTF